MILIDTSCWIHAFRRQGDPAIRARLTELLKSGEAAWCAPVRLELWSGIGSDTERQVLIDFERYIPDYPITPEVWQLACQLASQGRKNGKTFPVTDLLVAACSIYHKLPLEHADKHFHDIKDLSWNFGGT